METNDTLLGTSVPDNQASAFTDDDINDILEDNGITSDIQDPEFEEDAYNESQGEGGGIDAERHLEESRNSFQQALDEATESTHHDEDNEEPSNEESPLTEEVSIPLNSPTLLIDESTTRFSGAEWFSEIQKARVIIAGQGGIGSNLSFQIARMTPACITMYDDDVVENVNMAGQLYSYSDIGDAKVNAIARMINLYTSARRINAINSKFTSATEPGDIMLCGFDNMKARRTFFDSWYNHIEKKTLEKKKKCLYMDGRLSMDTLQILCIRGDDDYNINRYSKEFLFTDAMAENTVCSMKQTTYLACMIGSLMTNLFTNFVANLLEPIIPYDLPFFTEYDAQNMIFKTES